MTDTEQFAVVTLLDARDTTLTRVWASRDDNGFTYPLVATREAAKAYAEAKEREYGKELGAPDNRTLTWEKGPESAEDNEGPIMHGIEYLHADGEETGAFVFNMIVHPDAASAENECAIRADVDLVETDWDQLLDGEEN
jgi:hypothetical protein